MEVKEREHLVVPYGCTVHGEDEIAAVVSVLRTSTQMGKHVREMERRVANLFAKKYGVMVNSGSSANYLAVELLSLPPGSEVITPALTFATTVAPLVKNNLIPVFIDVDLETYNIDVSAIEAMITPNTKAMMIPNLLGNLPDWQTLSAIAKRHNIALIEDSADTLGATLSSISSGAYSDISTTSFYGSHIINCAGNGGMLCVNNQELADRAKLLRSWGRSSSLYVDSEAIENRFNTNLDGIEYDAKFIFEMIGYNLEPSEMGAAFGLVQLDKLSSNIAIRQHFFSQHCLFFKKYEDWFILPKQFVTTHTAWLAFPLIVRDSAPFTRRHMQIYFEKHGIQTRTVFTGNVMRQPAFKDIQHIKSFDGYQNADYIMRGGILLACHHGLTNHSLEYIHETFANFARGYHD